MGYAQKRQVGKTGQKRTVYVGQAWHGGRYWSTSIERETEAEAKVDAMREEERRAKLDLDNVNPDWTVEEMGTALIADMRLHDSPDPQTIERYEIDFKALIYAYPVAKERLKSLDDKPLRKWMDIHLRQGLGELPPRGFSRQKTAKSMMSLILTRAGEEGLLKSAPSSRKLLQAVQPKQNEEGAPPREMPHIEFEQYQAMLAVPVQTREEIAFQLFVWGLGVTGCRPSEMSTSVPEQVDVAEERFRVYRTSSWLRKPIPVHPVTGQRVKNGEEHVLDTVFVHDPKTHEKRDIPMDEIPSGLDWLHAMRLFIEKENIGPGEIIFSRARLGVRPGRQPKAEVDFNDPEVLAQLTTYRKEVRGVMRTFRHGTRAAYADGGCRGENGCEWCAAAERQGHRAARARRRATKVTRGPRMTRTWVERPPTRDIVAYDELRKQFRAMAAKAGLPHADKVWPYLMRHGFTTWMLEQDEAPIFVRDVLGHSDIRTTQKYHKRGSAKRRKGSVPTQVGGVESVLSQLTPEEKRVLAKQLMAELL